MCECECVACISYCQVFQIEARLTTLRTVLTFCYNLKVRYNKFLGELYKMSHKMIVSYPFSFDLNFTISSRRWKGI